MGPVEPTRPAPVLWHLKASHYSEKVRWALDHKGVPHLRRTATPGAHAEVAEELWGGRTFPVLDLGDEVVGGSADVIATIEGRWPEHPLYPGEWSASTEALGLEDLFDEELGPCTRLLAVQRLLGDRRLLFGAFTPELGGPRRIVAGGLYPLLRRRVAARLRIDEASVEQARNKCRAVCRPFESTFRAGKYLVGDRFSVADLTLAALLAPIVAPVQYPYPQPQREHPSFADLRDLLDRYGARQWSLEMYARHRPPSAEIETRRKALTHGQGVRRVSTRPLLRWRTRPGTRSSSG